MFSGRFAGRFFFRKGAILLVCLGLRVVDLTMVNKKTKSLWFFVCGAGVPWLALLTVFFCCFSS